MSIPRDRGLFGGDRMLISERYWSVSMIVCRSQNNVELFIGIMFGGLDRSETRLRFHFEVKFRSLSSLDLFSFGFSHCVLMFSGGEWPELISQR